MENKGKYDDKLEGSEEHLRRHLRKKVVRKKRGSLIEPADYDLGREGASRDPLDQYETLPEVDIPVYNLNVTELEEGPTVEYKTPQVYIFSPADLFNGMVDFLSVKNLYSPQAGLALLRKFKEIDKGEFRASFEIDSNLQAYLDFKRDEGRSISNSEFPGIGYALNYCIRNGIDVIANGNFQQLEYSGILRANREFFESLKGTSLEDYDRKVADWQGKLDEICRQKARTVAEKLESILNEADYRKVIHVTSDEMIDYYINFI